MDCQKGFAAAGSIRKLEQPVLCIRGEGLSRSFGDVTRAGGWLGNGEGCLCGECAVGRA